MHVVRLSIHRLRRFHTVELHPSSALNLLTGDNGAGKTSVLEALHLMAYGRSFRGRVRDGLIQQGADDLEVFVEWKEGDSAAGERTRRAGLRHSGQEWTGRLDGEDVAQLGSLCAALAVVTFEPGSHVLISGGGEPRRRFLDWGLFHVEPDFLTLWRRYARALKQRNALLKQGAQPRMLDAWDHELAESGESLTSRRTRYLERLQEWLVPVADAIAPALGLTALAFAPGWKRHELSLADALLLARERDRQNGYTSQGPHRADWMPSFQALPGRTRFPVDMPSSPPLPACSHKPKTSPSNAANGRSSPWMIWARSWTGTIRGACCSGWRPPRRRCSSPQRKPRLELQMRARSCSSSTWNTARLRHRQCPTEPQRPARAGWYNSSAIPLFPRRGAAIAAFARVVEPTARA